MSSRTQYRCDGKIFEWYGDHRLPVAGDYYLMAERAPVLCVVSHPHGSPARAILTEVGAVPTSADDGLTRVQGEVVATPPLRRIDVASFHPQPTPSATVGFSRANNGDTRIRLELTKRFVRNTGMQDHKDRWVVAPKMNSEVARRLGRALIEAADAAESGNYEYSKRS
jgi:hypothetical protein